VWRLASRRASSQSWLAVNARYLQDIYGASLRRERALAAGRAVQVGKILKGG
jgi:hypothetical protein